MLAGNTARVVSAGEPTPGRRHGPAWRSDWRLAIVALAGAKKPNSALLHARLGVQTAVFDTFNQGYTGCRRRRLSAGTLGRVGFRNGGTLSSELEYRLLESHEFDRIRDIDRSERVTLGYRILRGELQPMAVDWDVPTFRPDGQGSHTVPAQVRFCERHLVAGARAMGAFDGGALVAIGLMTPAVRPGMAQLAYLHVSRAYRRGGVASHLLEELLRFAIDSGARQVYVSSVASESAVGFYRARGFRLATPLPELHDQEPEDIHMVLDLPNSRLMPPAGAGRGK